MKYDIESIKNLIKISDYSFHSDWFFPCDLIPHSNLLKYSCKKLYEQGKLERQRDNIDRWGYQYRIKPIN